MKVLILGAKGNLGGQLVKIFSENKENEIIGWDKNEIDITDKELVIKKVNDIKPDIIINASAYNNVDKCEEDSREFEIAKKINGEAVGYIAKAALNNKAIVIHYSTDYVFGGEKKEGYMEIDETNPINNYGKSKLMGEKELISLSGKGLKWYLIRTSKLFGPRGKSEFSKPSFFEMMLKLAKNKKEIEAVNEELSCFTYTPDLAKATLNLVDSEKGYGIYHIVNNHACTWYDAVKELYKIAGINIKVNSVLSDKFPRPAKRPKYSILINTKLQFLRSYKEALKEYLKV